MIGGIGHEISRLCSHALFDVAKNVAKVLFALV